MGQDKGLMMVNGKPLVQYVIDVVKQQTKNIVIVTNNSDYKKIGYPILEDKVKNIGPIGGIYTALLATKTDLNLILTCDSPFITSSMLNILIEKAIDYDVSYLSCNDRVFPLTAVYNKNVNEMIKEMIDQGKYKVRDLFTNISCNNIVLSYNKADKLININSRKDLNLIK